MAIYDLGLRELLGRGTLAPSDPVLLLDAWDTVVLGDADELYEKLSVLQLLGSGGGILCAADRLCAPEYRLAPEIEELYPHASTPWRYPNSGGLAGTADALARLLDILVGGGTADDGQMKNGFCESCDDQLRLQNVLLTRAAQG